MNNSCRGVFLTTSRAKMLPSTWRGACAAWLVNQGYAYENRIHREAAGETLIAFYAARYTHSTQAERRDRIERGAVRLDGRVVDPDTVLKVGQVLTYRRSPWVEPAAP
jgi:23S rRNA pseudouridine1911/1915/1917 synthase